jgi:thioredoxin
VFRVHLEKVTAAAAAMDCSTVLCRGFRPAVIASPAPPSVSFSSSSDLIGFRERPGFLRLEKKAVRKASKGVGAEAVLGSRDTCSFPSTCANIATARPHVQQVHAAKQTFSSFDDMIEKSDLPVLVDFYAIWCGPCQVMVPILNHVGQALKEKIRVVKIDTEKYPSIASRFSVQALPTFVLFQNGKPVMRLEGVVQAQELIGQIERALYLLQSKA